MAIEILRYVAAGSGDTLELLDQRELPRSEVWLSLGNATEVAEAIRSMAVRGAPAIGIVAAFGMALAAKRGERLEEADSVLRASRPTAVNLFWALDRIKGAWGGGYEAILAEARAIHTEDIAMNERMGVHGASLIRDGDGIVTICNTGALATGGHGTALGVIRTAHAQGKKIHVYSCETRPRQQGLRLTAFELLRESIPFHSVADGAVAALMASGKVQIALAGADRIASNGDSANKIGTQMLAIVAAHYKVLFYIVAPTSTIDPGTPNGTLIPIEERNASELTHIEGVPIAPEGTPVWNPAFDVTPQSLIAGIVTEQGIHRPPYRFV